MRLVSYLVEGEPRYGAAVDSGVVDLTKRIGRGFSDVKALIAANALDDARNAVVGQKPDYALKDLDVLPPVLAPEKLWCIGVNYAERNAEYKDNRTCPNIRACSCATPRRWSAPVSRSRSRKCRSSSTMKANSSS
jgi:2-keto-4-pentenoate hydratase/2-oxohepta-3-ene-1,7-dioic acid hydratase in catechol pathway